MAGASGTIPNQVQLFNPEGELVQVPLEQAQQAQAAGYTPASQADAQSYLNEQKYGGTGETLKTFAEGAARGATFGLSSAVEKGLGVKPEDILARQETNPVASMLGEGAGIAGSMFVPGVGAGSLAAHVGEGAADLAAHAAPGLVNDANIIGKVGSAVVKGAVENAVFAGGDEVSKAILQDPNQSFQSAITDIGLGSLIGAGAGGMFGAVNPLWEATVGPKAQSWLNMITDRANGNSMGATETVKNLEAAGAQIPDHLKAFMSENPEARAIGQELAESGTSSGDTFRNDITATKESIHGVLTNAIDGGEQISAKEAGDQAKQVLAQDMETRNGGVRDAYDAVAPSKDVATTPEMISDVQAKLKSAAGEFGAEGSPLRQEFERWSDRLGLQQNVGHLDKLMTELGSEWSVANRAGNFEQRRAIQEIRDIIRDGTNGLLDQAIPGAKDAAAQARGVYKDTIEHVQEIAKAGGLGKVKSIGQFQEALEKIPSEKLADRLFNPNNVKALEYLQEHYPQVHDLLAKQARAEILAKGTTAKGVFNPNNIFREVEKLPEEVRKMVFKPEQLQQIASAREALKAIPDRINPSGTARTLDKLWQHMPGGGTAMVGMLMGHNPLAGLVLGQAGKFLGRDIPDAAKLSLLKFLGSSGPVDASAWKTTADVIEKMYKGEALIQKATKAVFTGGKAVLPDAMYPSEKKIEKLDKHLEALAQNPESLLNVGGKTGQYMPEVAQGMGQTAANAVSWLNSQRPKQAQLGILDERPPIPQEVQDHWQRTLSIAEQPLVSLQHLKDGTLQAADVQTVQTLYPQLYQKLVGGLTSELIKSKAAGTSLPYHSLLGMSLFMSQPLDGTMTPQGIQALQNASMPMQAANQGPVKPTQSGMKALSQQPDRYQTPGQDREEQNA